MPNPYVTIPAMPRWAQQAWLQQYLATRNQPPTPSTGALIGTGVLGALDQGLGAVTKNWQLQAGLDQQMALESMRESAATDRQQALFDQQTAMKEAERQAAALKAQREGIASGAFLSRYNTPELTPVAPGTQDIPYSPDRAERGGAVPPTRFSDESLRAAEAQNVSAESLGATPFPVAPSEMSGYRGGTAATAEIPRPPLSRHRSAIDALTSLGALGTMVPGDMVTRAQEDEKMRREKQPTALTPEQQLKQRELAWYDAVQGYVSRGEPVPSYLADIGRMMGYDKTPTPKETRGWSEGLPGPAQLLEIAQAAPGDPILSDPRLLRDFGTPERAQARARSVVGPARNLQEYEQAIQRARGLGLELGKQDAPMGPEAENWVNPRTYQSAQGLSEAEARRQGYVSITNTQRKYLDEVLDSEIKARAVVPLFDNDLIGPVQGRLNYTLMLAGQAPPGFADLYNYMTELRATVQRLRAGAQVGPREEVYTRNLPDYTMNADQARSALSQVLFGLQMVKSRIVNRPVVPEAGAAPTPGQDLVTPPAENRLDRFERAREELRSRGYATDDNNVTQFLMKNPGF